MTKALLNKRLENGTTALHVGCTPLLGTAKLSAAKTCEKTKCWKT